jgi:dTDP-4-amino-4,6-dideoxygalactose transaminase
MSTASAPSGVPLLDLKRQYSSIRTEVLAAIERVCDSQQFVLGPETQAFEQEFAARCSAHAATGCTSGTDALWLALSGAGVRPGSKVLTTPFTFIATATSIVRAGCTPLFADIDSETLNLDAAAARKVLEAQPKGSVSAILPVHLYGQCADVDALGELAKEFAIPLVEDAAQAYSAQWNGRTAGSLGRTAAFSFYPTKNLSAFGDAGCATSSDEESTARIRRLRNHGSDRRYYHTEIGWNARIDGIQSAVLRVKLRHIDEWNARRASIAALYDSLFADAGLTGGGKAPVRLTGTRPEAHHVHHQYVIRTAQRDQLMRYLRDRKIGCEIFYPLGCHLQACFANLGYKPGDLPLAERAAQEVVALPMYAELREDEAKTVVEAIASFFA